VGSKDDPSSGGRQMPSHWCDPSLHIVSQSSATGTQCLHAIGCAEAGMLYERLTGIPDRLERFESDEVVYVSVGEGATSEGEFWESINVACLRQLPVVYLVEDKCDVSSVHAEGQTAGASISRPAGSCPRLQVVRCDGAATEDSYGAMSEAAAWCRDRQGPALVHATVPRPSSHSHSDDERN